MAYLDRMPDNSRFLVMFALKLQCLRFYEPNIQFVTLRSFEVK
jgi:hypothetical protein